MKKQLDLFAGAESADGRALADQFDGHRIRSKVVDGARWFSIVDVIGALTDSPYPRTYWEKLKNTIKTNELGQSSPFWGRLKLSSTDGKSYVTDCATREGVLRLIQSVPSPKAEPFKLWLARVGEERLRENMIIRELGLISVAEESMNELLEEGVPAEEALERTVAAFTAMRHEYESKMGRPVASSVASAREAGVEYTRRGRIA